MEIKLKSRKILGWNYTNFVSLPKDWMRTHNLEKGDVVDVLIDENGSLLVKPGDKNEKKKC